MLAEEVKAKAKSLIVERAIVAILTKIPGGIKLTGLFQVLKSM